MRLSLKTTLAALFCLLALVAAGQGVLTIWKLDGIRHGVTEVATNWLPSVVAVNRIRSSASEVRLKQYRLVTASSDAQKLAANRQQYEVALEGLAQARKRYEPMITSVEERALYERFSGLWDAYQQTSRHLLGLMEAGQQKEALAELANADTLKIYTDMGEALTQNVSLNERGAQGDADASVGNVETAALTAYVSVAIALVTALGAMLFGFLRISRPITRMTEAMRVLAGGDTASEVPYRGRSDEIGAMAAAVQVFKDNLVRTRQLEEETALARASAEERRKAAMRQMADSFENAVGGIVGLVSSSATELQATAQTMTATATETASQSTTVAAAAEEAASNVATVAAAAEELGSSVQEIGRQVNGSAQLAQAAVTEAGQTADLVQELSGAVAKIGDVVTMISTIAGQTNLLALNATIEAARAGEAGRGFAVVASEVKELASQTGRATEEISGQIARIQGSTGQAVQAIGSIAARIQEISGVATAIAAAVEEQGAATQEIVRNVAQAAMGTGEVTSNISGVAGAAEETGAAASQVLGAASELSRQSEHLSAEVSRFLATVRTA
ncbi:methyl-accepting chemotaxis protein [uncultured Methylobacterium sp.]|uniref:methyl-accepting chemotaxis protein n=1 Tax=uncultured Methylobacterium sp. TaxID=157278 RepID=UPI0025999664|nr:methyl-accepting chemotaxis protein [uncultured Methylobacterium sp.]